MDLVLHYGSSILGEYINTLSTTEVSSGWWEGEAIWDASKAGYVEWVRLGIKAYKP